jgi:hypothetical protein
LGRAGETPDNQKNKSDYNEDIRQNASALTHIPCSTFPKNRYCERSACFLVPRDCLRPIFACRRASPRVLFKFTPEGDFGAIGFAPTDQCSLFLFEVSASRNCSVSEPVSLHALQGGNGAAHIMPRQHGLARGV